MKKKLPTFRSDREAEEFVEKADLTDYDLSGLRPAKLEFEKKNVSLRMRAVKKPAKPRAQEGGMRTTTILSVALPPELAREAERTAKMKGRTENDLLCEALRRYLLEEKVQRLQQDGARRARRLRIKPADVERLIQEYRARR